MLKAMRKNVKSLAPTLWFVIAAFIISIFAVWGGGGMLGEGRGRNILATAGSEKISTELYVANLRQRLEDLQRQFKELDINLIQQLNLPQQVLEQLIQQSLLLQKAKEMGIRASSEEIREKIKSYPVFQQEGTFVGFERYKQILEWNRISISEFEESLKKDIRIEKVIQVLTAGVTVTPEEIWTNYKNTNESVRMEYVVLEAEDVNLEEESSPEVLADYFKAHMEEYTIPERREGAYILFNAEEMRVEIELSDSDIERYYKDNRSQFQDPERIRVSRLFLPLENKDRDQILAEIQTYAGRLQAGEDFGALAKAHSQDDKAEQGGDWGLYEWKSLAAEEQGAVAELAAGGVSDPITLETGISLLKVTEKEPAKTKPVEDVRSQITDILKDQKARELADRRATQLEKNAQKQKSLKTAAQKMGYQVQSTGLFKEGDPIEDTDPSGLISQELFKLEENGISSLVYTYKGIGIVQHEKTESSRPANFDEVETEVKEDLTVELKREKARQTLEAVKSELAGRSLEQLAESRGLEHKSTEEHKRGQYLSLIGENQEVDKLAFSLPMETASDPIAFKDGYTLIRVIDRKEVTRDDFEKNKASERDSLLEAERNKYFQSLMSKIREQKGVNIKHDLFLKINTDILSRYQKQG